ncbi:MAG: transcriptional regulator [Bacteroidota bacterium]
MSLLMVNDQVDFNTLKRRLKLSDGNLASHLNTLEKKEFIEVQKGFIGRKTQTNYKATKMGRLAFQEHLDALEAIIKGNPEESEGA